MTMDEIIEKLTEVRDNMMSHQAISIESLNMEKNKHGEIYINFYYKPTHFVFKGRDEEAEDEDEDDF